MNFQDKLLDFYSLTEDDFNELSRPIEDIKLLDVSTIEVMPRIKDRIFSAINNKEKILIYGDYDCDGVSATTIMVKTFAKLGYPVSYYLPIRYSDGYGLNVANVEKIAKAGFKLIITVDNGISQHDAIDLANKNGIDVIVVDHHEAPEKEVNAYAILHPIVSNISDIYASGGYMSLFLSAGLLGYYDDYLVTIAGLSVVSDLMMLKGYNRDVVRLAINNLDKYRYKPLVYLLDSPIITEKSFGIEIAPKINSIGRLIEDKNINLLVKYLISEDEDEIFKISSWIKNNNELRKVLTRETAESLPKEGLNEASIVLNLKIKEGLLGLVANRLLDQNNLPTVIFTEDSNDPEILKGSARSKEGFNIVEAFAYLRKYMLGGGGHASAGGLTIKKADFEEFKHEFNEFAKIHPIVKTKKPSIEIALQDVNFENYRILRKLAPFGMGFDEPSFIVNDLPTKSLKFISEGKHLSTPISMNSKLLGFNIPESEVKLHKAINVTGNFYVSVFKEKKTVELRINDYSFNN